MAPVVSILDGAPDLAYADYAYDSEAPAAPALPSKPTLRGRIERVEFIASTIEALDDESLTPELRDALSAELIAELAGARERVDACASALAMFESLEASAEREIERLDKRAKRYERARVRLEDYVLAILSASNLTRLDGDTSTLTARRNPPSVRIADGAEISHEFLAFPDPPPPHPDKAAIARALKAGRKIAGCSLEQSKRLARS